MPQIEVAPADYRRVMLLARAWGTGPTQVVGRLLDEFEQATGPAPGTREAVAREEHRVPIHAVYNHHRIDALFDPRTERVEITSGELAGRAYRSPSGAAVAVVSLYNRSVNPNRNGWSFWAVTDSGELLQSLRDSR